MKSQITGGNISMFSVALATFIPRPIFAVCVLGLGIEMVMVKYTKKESIHTHTQISVQIFIIPSPLIILKLLVYWRLLFHCKISGTIYLDPPTTTHNLSVEMALELVGR